MAQAHVEIPLHGKHAHGRVALIDVDDYDEITRHRWFLWEQKHASGRPGGPYAMRTYRPRAGDRRTTTTKMHKQLTGWRKTDHQNHNGLDNRRFNLRPATDGQNMMNSIKRLNCSSKHKGVNWCKREQLWRARIRKDGFEVGLGYFQEELDAARAYNDAAIDLFGDYALLNDLGG